MFITSFNTMSTPTDLTEHVIEAIDRVVEYLWDTEQAHLEECLEEGEFIDSHIFDSLLTIRHWLDQVRLIID